MTLKGIDISVYQQTTPNLAGLSFVFVRGDYDTLTDAMYAAHAANVRKAGLVLGAYLFGTARSTPQAQAAALLKVGANADLLALDLESSPTPMTNAEAAAFIAAIHAAGRTIGLYHSLSGYPDLGQDWNWVADWAPTPPPHPWTFWQESGSPLDTDIFAGDLAALHALIGGSMTLTVSDPKAALLDLAVGVQTYTETGAALTKILSGGANLHSPYGSGARRAVVISLGGVTQLAFVNLGDCQNVRPLVYTQADVNADVAKATAPLNTEIATLQGQVKAEALKIAAVKTAAAAL